MTIAICSDLVDPGLLFVDPGSLFVDPGLGAGVDGPGVGLSVGDPGLNLRLAPKIWYASGEIIGGVALPPAASTMTSRAATWHARAAIVGLWAGFEKLG
jgi:hypothetical protein